MRAAHAYPLIGAFLRRSDATLVILVGPSALDRFRHLCYKAHGDVSVGLEEVGDTSAFRSGLLRQADIRNGEDRGWNC